MKNSILPNLLGCVDAPINLAILYFLTIRCAACSFYRKINIIKAKISADISTNITLKQEEEQKEQLQVKGTVTPA